MDAAGLTAGGFLSNPLRTRLVVIPSLHAGKLGWSFLIWLSFLYPFSQCTFNLLLVKAISNTQKAKQNLSAV
jgi:hypothetical protein